MPNQAQGTGEGTVVVVLLCPDEAVQVEGILGGHRITPGLVSKPSAAGIGPAQTRHYARTTGCVRDSTRFAASKIAYMLT